MIKLLMLSLEHPHAHHYLECLRQMPEVQVVAVAEPDSGRLHGVSEFLEAMPVYADCQKMLREVPADAAIVCSANAKHKDMVIHCARAGIPTLCEKPMATKAADAREMLAVCQAHEVPLGMCFPARFSEALVQAKHRIGQGEMGKVLAVKATNHGTMPGDWFIDPELSGGGAIMDHTVHVVDALRWLFEAEFTQVFGHASSRLYNLAVEDAGLLTLEMSNEVIVTLDASWSRPKRSFPSPEGGSRTRRGARGGWWSPLGRRGPGADLAGLHGGVTAGSPPSLRAGPGACLGRPARNAGPECCPQTPVGCPRVTAF